MSYTNLEQRCLIRYYFRLGHSATEIFSKLQQNYGDSVLSRAQVFRWHKAFAEGRESIEDEPRSGRPSVSRTDANVHRVRDLLYSDRRLTVRMVDAKLNLNHSIVHQILANEPGKRKFCTENLKHDQKEMRRGRSVGDSKKNVEAIEKPYVSSSSSSSNPIPGPSSASDDNNESEFIYNPKIKIEVNTLDAIDESFDPNNDEDEKKILREPIELSKEKLSKIDEDERFVAVHDIYGGDNYGEEAEEDPLSFDVDTTGKSVDPPKLQLSDSDLLTSSSSKPVTSLRKRRKTIAENKENFSKSDDTLKKEELVDEDKEFLLSLLPIMKELTSSQKCEFKSSVLKELNRIKYPKPIPTATNTKVTKTLNTTTLTSVPAPPLNTLITVLPYGFPIQNHQIQTNIKKLPPGQQTITSDKTAQGTNKTFLPQQTNIIKLPVGGPLNLINIPKSMLSNALQNTTVTSGNVTSTAFILNTSLPKNITTGNVSEVAGKSSPLQTATVSDSNKRNISVGKVRKNTSGNNLDSSSKTGPRKRAKRQLRKPMEDAPAKNSDHDDNEEEEQMYSDITVEEIKIEPLDIKEEPLDTCDEDDFIT